MIDQKSYAIQAEKEIFKREEDNREALALAYIENLQYEFQDEYGQLTEYEAMLLDIKRSKIDSLETDLKLLSFHIEDKENELFSLIKKRKELKFNKINAQEDLEKYEQKLKDRKKEEDYLLEQAEKIMGADSGEF